MGVYIVPAYIKPGTKIATWIIPMCYVEEENNEFINDNGIVRIVIKDKIEYFSKGVKMAMKVDAFGEPTQHKVHIFDTKLIIKPIEMFLSTACKDVELARVEGIFNLLGTSGINLIQEVFKQLDKDTRSQVAVPLQWLVYKPDEKLLTRLCWVNEINGKIIVKPYSERNLLLEVQGDIKLDKVNTFSLQTIKKNIITKNALNEEWRQMVAEVIVTETLTEMTTIGEFTEEKKERVGEGEEIGKVE